MIDCRKLFILYYFLLMTTPLCAEYSKSQILVKFKSLEKKTEEKSVNTLYQTLNAKEIKKYTTTNVRQIELPIDISVEEAIKKAYANPDILYAEPNYIVRTTQIPNDVLYNQLWGLEKISAPSAWNTVTGSSDIIVAVIDTGVDYNHEDLLANMWISPIGTHGYDFYNNDDDPMDDYGHGTHCAGIIGGATNNGIGISGVAWDVKIMACKFLNSSGTGYVSGAISAIEYAVNNGAVILNNSWGSASYSQALEDAIVTSHNAGALFIASAGNYGTNNDVIPHYPSSYTTSNIISVGASNIYDELASFSCYGYTAVDLVAPGRSILSTYPNNKYHYSSGTSMSAPYVSGACALIWTENPSLTNLQVRTKLLQSVDDIYSLEDLVASGGRLNVSTAVADEEQSLNTTWYFAEGCTNGFDEWVLIMNPNNTLANVTVTFITADGESAIQRISISAVSRYTIHVNDVMPNTSVSVKLECTNSLSIIAERVMYWDAGGIKWAGGHCSLGATSTATTWYLAEGCTGADFDEWVLIMNPSQEDATVLITFILEEGNNIERNINVPGFSRITIYVNDVVLDSSVSVKVQSTNGVGIIVERTMYWNRDGIEWIGGHCSIGAH